MAISRLSALDSAIRAAGIPIDGVSLGANAPSTVVVSYQTAATAQQRTQGQGIVDGFDYRNRVDLTRAQIVSGIAALTTAQQNTLLRYILAFLALQNPGDVADMLATAGIPLAIDQVGN